MDMSLLGTGFGLGHGVPKLARQTDNNASWSGNRGILVHNHNLLSRLEIDNGARGSSRQHLSELFDGKSRSF
jgi:hypothetical protein